MEDGDRRNIPFPAADQAAEASAESSRSESNSVESGVTVDSSRCRSGEAESCGNADTRLEECTGWTDEKHNSYLDSLEKSFIRQLYYLLGGKTHKSFRSHNPPANYCKSTDQFAVLQNGCWQEINFGKKRTHLDASSDFSPRKSPLTSHFADPKSVGATVRGSLSPNEEVNCCADKAFPRASARNHAEMTEYHLHHECSNESSAESSGQNFVDEDKKDNPSSSSPVPKRHKRDAGIDNSVGDQVVPLGKVNQRDACSPNQVFTGCPQSFNNIQNAGDHHRFVRGS